MADLFVPNKQRIRGIERLEVEPRDFPATAKFWRQLGFQVTIKGDPGRREATLRAGEVRVLFREPPDDPEMDRRRSAFTRLRIAFSVRDFDAYLEELRSKGVEVPAPSRHHGFARAVELVDPNGIRILLEEAPT
ncbi:MAG TPA: VOC family protein [Planctomycetota bacterium]|nr:VOC family protein [Planctomycetota bacterium]